MMPKVTLEDIHASWELMCPIVKITRDAGFQLIGTGFFITTTGVLVTAKHVVTDNIRIDGQDAAPIGAIQFYMNEGKLTTFQFRSLVYSSLHSQYDLAVCETTQLMREDGSNFEGKVLTLTTSLPEIGSRITTLGFHRIKNVLANEAHKPLASVRFEGRACFGPAFEQQDFPYWIKPEMEFELSYEARITDGHLKQVFPAGRDRGMLPFPCFESDLPIHGGMSGGPVFDERGRVFGVNCTSIGNVAYHAPIEGILDLHIQNTHKDGDVDPRSRTIEQLALDRFVAFEP